MAQITPASEAIATLLAQGWKYSDIGRSLGVNASYIRQGINPSAGQRQKPLAKYVGALQSLEGQKPGAKPGALPGKRVTKSGAVAGVRQGLKSVTTRSGKQQSVARVKKGPATLKRAIRKAAASGSHLKWDINFKKMKTQSGAIKQNAWATGQLPDGWTAQTLMDRIDNPKPEEGDTWAAGDVNGALVAICLEQNTDYVDSASGPQEFSMFTQ